MVGHSNVGVNNVVVTKIDVVLNVCSSMYK